MFNVSLFVVSTVLVFGIFFWFKGPTKWSDNLKYITVAALLCTPFNIEGNVFTVFGSNDNPTGSVYSIASLYQNAGNNADVVIGLAGYQKAGNNADVGLGLVGYQEAGNNADVVIGLAGYQKAGNNAGVGLGLVGYQKIPGESRMLALFSELTVE